MSKFSEKFSVDFYTCLNNLYKLLQSVLHRIILINFIVVRLCRRPFIFAALSDDELNRVIPLFLTEVVKKDGSQFPPTSLRAIVLSLQKYLEVNDGRIVRFLSDKKFRAIQDALESVVKRAASMGLAAEPRQGDIITEQMENVLWEKGLLGDGDPETLLHTMVFLCGLHFSLGGRDDHRRLRHSPSQLSLRMTGDGRSYLEYKEVFSYALFLI